ncbi:MAG: GDSL-type esterase/lipase family protein [Bacteroidota bacterium]
MTKKLLLASLLLNLVFIAGFFFLIRKLGGANYVWFKMRHQGVAGVYEHRKNMYDLLPIRSSDVVFVGNSITEQGNWAELLGRQDVRNRGIAGDVTQGLLDRLPVILEGHPRQIFLMIGINDLIAHDPSYVIDNYREIVRRILQKSPETRLVLQSILPVNNEVRISGLSNEDVRQINQAIETLASEVGADYVDVHSLLQDEKGQLAARFTQDGIHINGEAYLIWKNAVSNYIVPALPPETEPVNRPEE